MYIFKSQSLCLLEANNDNSQVHILFQSQFSTQSHLVLPLSICRILSFPYGHPAATYISFLVFPSLLNFLLPRLHKRIFEALPTQYMTNPVSLPSFIVHRTFLSCLTLCNTSSFFTRSVQLIFTILFQHHISKLFWYF